MTTTTEKVRVAGALDDVDRAVRELDENLPGLIEQTDDPDGLDLAQLLADVRSAREQLLGMERRLEAETAKAMSGDLLQVDGLFRVERRRTPDRKEWDYAAWTSDARKNLLRRRGLARAVGVVTDTGEVVETSLAELLRAAEDIHGKGAPRVTALRDLGLDPDEYCERKPGHPKVTIIPLASEEGTE